MAKKTLPLNSIVSEGRHNLQIESKSGQLVNLDLEVKHLGLEGAYTPRKEKGGEG